jgi:hypothetical protein
MDESDEFPVQEDSNYAIAILRIDEPLHPPDEIKGRVGLIVAEPGQVRSVAPDTRSMLGDNPGSGYVSFNSSASIAALTISSTSIPAYSYRSAREPDCPHWSTPSGTTGAP